MADNNEPTLRNALDAVNTGRKYTLFGVAALFFGITITLGFVFSMLVPSIVQPPGPAAAGAAADTTVVPLTRVMPLKALWMSTAFQLFFVACGTIAIMLHTSRMTRAILRAIESTRR